MSLKTFSLKTPQDSRGLLHASPILPRVVILAASLVLSATVARADETKGVGAAVAESTELPTAAPEDVGMSSEKLASVKSSVQRLVDERKLPGAIVVVARRGRIVFGEAVGWSDIEAEKPLEQDAILRFYSMTKPITSVAVMRLVEQGKVGLDDPVSKFVPEFEGVKVFVEEKDGQPVLEDVKRPMTVRDLLRHTSGLTYGFFGESPVDQQYLAAQVLAPTDTLEAMAGKLGKLPLLCQPGTRFNYSVSTDVLGMVVENASGQRLDRFLRQHVFEPLDMRDTDFHVPDKKTDRLTNNYGPREEGDGLRVIDAAAESRYRQPPTLYSGGGGLVSTARDYVRFCQMLLGEGKLGDTRLLASDTVKQMMRNQLPEQAYPISLNGRRDGVGFGLGLAVIVERTEFTGDSQVGECGWGGAASTHFWISPKEELVVVALTQHRPFTFLLEETVKPLVYDAIVE